MVDGEGCLVVRLLMLGLLVADWKGMRHEYYYGWRIMATFEAFLG